MPTIRDLFFLTVATVSASKVCDVSISVSNTGFVGSLTGSQNILVTAEGEISEKEYGSCDLSRRQDMCKWFKPGEHQLGPLLLSQSGIFDMYKGEGDITIKSGNDCDGTILKCYHDKTAYTNPPSNPNAPPVTLASRYSGCSLSRGRKGSDEGIQCIGGQPINLNDADQAIAALKADCDQGNKIGGKVRGVAGHRSKTYGSVTAYVCNYSANVQQCHSNEFNLDTPGGVKEECQTHAGWYNHREWGPKTYGLTHAGDKVC